MPIPLIVGAVIAAGAAAGGGGLVLGGRGGLAIKRAKGRIDAAAAQYEARKSLTDARVEEINQRLADYGTQQAEAVDRVVKRMVDFLIRHERVVRENESLLIDGLDNGTAGQVLSKSGVIGGSLAGIAGGVAGGAAAGAGVGAAASALATTVGTASTGAAISGLGGAAASNAALAWLGGGAISAGGGGMAAGAIVVNSVVAGPAVLVAGFAVGAQGAKATTKADKVEADVAVAMGELDVFDVALGAVEERVDELSAILADLENRGVAALNELESEPFDVAAHSGRFQRAMILVKAVRDVVATPIVDDEGGVTVASNSLIVRMKQSEPQDSTHVLASQTVVAPTASGEAVESPRDELLDEPKDKAHA